jgi:hypothetical protein
VHFEIDRRPVTFDRARIVSLRKEGMGPRWHSARGDEGTRSVLSDEETGICEMFQPRGPLRRN